MQTIAIIVNGLFEVDNDLIHKIENCDMLFLVDGGANYFRELLSKAALKLRPKAIIGDFDSVSEETLNTFKQSHLDFVRLDRAKDKTDLEAALEYIDCKYPHSIIRIFGGFGKRIDHTLANLFLLSKYPKQLFYETPYETTFSIKESSIDLDVQVGQTISLIPLFGACTGVKTQGLKWELENFTLNFSGISNISLKENCLIAVEKGTLLCMINHLLDQEMIFLQDKSSTSTFCKSLDRERSS